MAGRTLLCRLGLPAAGIDQILAATGAGRSSAFEAKNRILAALPGLSRPVGRPAAPAAAPPPAAGEISLAVLRIVTEHPGCVWAGPDRRGYSATFRRRVLDLRGKHPDVDLEDFADAAGVPSDTLRDWMRAGPQAAAEASTAPYTEPSPGNLRIQTVLAAWERWEGGFVSFCDHVREHLRVPLGRTAIAGILEAHGARLRPRRPGRSPDEKALRESFETFFAGAQWVADGTPVGIDFMGEHFTFNLELAVDAHTGAFTGISIRDEEDGAALVEAVADGKATTGAAPLALLVDNRPSNVTPEVHEALGEDTVLVRATQGRPQNKAHCEGAFGLFVQMLPVLLVAAADKREAAREVLRLVVTTWARTLNHRPRADRGGRSRVDLYGDKPTPEQIAEARAALAERMRRLEAARRTLQARQDPIVRQILAEAYARLGIADPDGHQLDATARYPLSAVLDGIAVYEGKRAAGSLPPDLELPGRYLLGIVRNLATEREGDLIAEAMLRSRLAARDAILAPLVELRRSIEREGAGAVVTVARFVDNAVAAERRIDRLFWLGAAGETIDAEPISARPALYRGAARRINAATPVPYAERLAALRALARAALPVD